MTSKEALSQLLCHATLDYNDFEPLEYIDLKRHYAEVISKLVKDLEVLEILKPILNNSYLFMIKNEKDYLKVKEWLNDK